MNVPSLLAIRCFYCSKQRAPWRVHRLDANAQVICDDCLAWHNKALDFLAGGAIPGCQGCGKSWEVLRDEEPGSRIRLYAVPKDGIYQVLCAVCIGPYVSRRSDLYAGTPFGSRLKL